MDSRATFRLDMVFQIGMVLWPLLKSEHKIHVLEAHQELLAGAPTGARASSKEGLQ